jgi:hypothetical protein
MTSESAVMSTSKIAHNRFSRAFKNLDNVLPSLVDAVAKHTGMVAMINLVGLCGEEGGNITVQRYARNTWRLDIECNLQNC